MNVDTQFQHAFPTVAPTRSVHQQPDQASARPVERPHHDEAAENDPRKRGGETGVQRDPRQPTEQGRVRQEAELSHQEKRQLEELQARDREVRAHEAAHKAAAGSLAQGGARYEFQTGPDGRRYAVGGEVSIDAAPVPGDPQATLVKAQTIRRAANAPAQPSAQDRTVAVRASHMEAEARRELSEQHGAEPQAGNAPAGAEPGSLQLASSEPAPVGELLDVIV
jgi:hypothetical protein